MSVIHATVVDKQINIDIKKRAGGTYKGYQIVYRTPEGQIETLAKTMQSLKFSPSVEQAVNDLQIGDKFTVTQQKNENGFLDVVSITKGDFASDVPVSAPDSAPVQTISRPVGGKVVGSNYETPEERKLKQRLIVRQAALNQALEYSRLCVDGPATQDEIKSYAEQFENWVYRGLE